MILTMSKIKILEVNEIKQQNNNNNNDAINQMSDIDNQEMIMMNILTMSEIEIHEVRDLVALRSFSEWSQEENNRFPNGYLAP